MDFVKGLTGNKGQTQTGDVNQPAQTSSGGGGGLMGKFNNMAGGGAQGEKKEDALDKGTWAVCVFISSLFPLVLTAVLLTAPGTGVDYVQERFLGQGSQNNESAVEQAKDEAMSDTIRSQYKNATGKDFPIADK